MLCVPDYSVHTYSAKAQALFRGNCTQVSLLSASKPFSNLVCGLLPSEASKEEIGSDFTSVLESGETILLGPSGINGSDRLILTNRRLVTFQREGLLKSKYKMIQECGLDQIDETYPEMDGLRCLMKLRTKNHGEWQWTLNVPSMAAFALGEHIIVVRQLAITTRWVNAVNKLLPRPTEP
jgi:hypothetical protein